MKLALLVLAATSTPTAELADRLDVFSVQARPTAVVVSLGAKNAEPGMSRTNLIREADSVLKQHSALAAVSPEQLGITTAALEACPLERRLGCWVREVDRAAPRGRVPQFLILISTERESGGLSLDGFILEVQPSLQRLKNSEFADPEALAGIEAELFGRAIRLSPKTVRGDAQQGLQSYLTPHIKKLVDARPELGPWTEVNVRTDAPGFELVVSGKPLGANRSTLTRLVDVPPGPLRVEIRDAGTNQLVREQTAEASLAEVAQLDLRAPPAPPAETTHSIAMWSGVGLAAAGLASIVMGQAALPAPSIDTTCTGNCGFRWAGTCNLAGGTRTECEGHRGLLLTPFGMALVGAGGSAAVGYAMADDSEFAWWWTPISVALGLVLYTVPALTN